jgi:hypothetical protein
LSTLNAVGHSFCTSGTQGCVVHQKGVVISALSRNSTHAKNKQYQARVNNFIHSQFCVLQKNGSNLQNYIGKYPMILQQENIALSKWSYCEEEINGISGEMFEV